MSFDNQINCPLNQPAVAVARFGKALYPILKNALVSIADKIKIIVNTNDEYERGSSGNEVGR